MRKLISLSIKCNKTEAIVFIEKIQNVVKGFPEEVQFGAHHRATYVDQTDQIHIGPLASFTCDRASAGYTAISTPNKIGVMGLPQLESDSTSPPMC